MSEITGVSSGGSPATSPAAKQTKKTSTDFKEHLARVSGHKYAKITDGPRKGMYVNQSGNDRDGDAFKLVSRGGHEYHVYGKIVVRVGDTPS